MGSTKRLLLVGVIASLAMLAVPALASASVWMKEGSELTEFAEINMKGLDIVETGEGNSMICEVNATMTTEGGEEALVTSYETEACPEKFGTFAKCELTSAEANGLPWEVFVNETDLTLEGWHTTRTFTGCGTSELNNTIGEVTISLNTPSLIESMEFSGKSGSYSIFDSMNLSEADVEAAYAIG